MRLFTAIELGDAVRFEAAALVGELRRRAERMAPRARVTWVAPDRMHLTLRFIGEVGDQQSQRIMSALRDPLALAPFVVQWAALGAFPSKGPPRVLWLGAGQGSEALCRVEAEISRRVVALGIPRADRPYSPHLTLARVREAGGVRTASLFEDLTPPRGETTVCTITLFQSRLSPRGPEYTVLLQTPLRDG